jgi:hypothetical protein
MMFPVADRLHDLIDDGGSISDVVFLRKPDQVAARDPGGL